jgi:hypothetical protein
MAKTEPLTDAQIEKQVTDFGKTLREGPQREIKLPQNPPSEPQLAPEDVVINGYFYKVPRGVKVSVPERVAVLLEQAGLL